MVRFSLVNFGTKCYTQKEDPGMSTVIVLSYPKVHTTGKYVYLHAVESYGELVGKWYRSSHGIRHGACSLI